MCWIPTWKGSFLTPPQSKGSFPKASVSLLLETEQVFSSVVLRVPSASAPKAPPLMWISGSQHFDSHCHRISKHSCFFFYFYIWSAQAVLHAAALKDAVSSALRCLFFLWHLRLCKSLILPSSLPTFFFVFVHPSSLPLNLSILLLLPAVRVSLLCVSCFVIWLLLGGISMHI